MRHANTHTHHKLTHTTQWETTVITLLTEKNTKSNIHTHTHKPKHTHTYNIHTQTVYTHTQTHTQQTYTHTHTHTHGHKISPIQTCKFTNMVPSQNAVYAKTANTDILAMQNDVR